jgi:hypothetical protein
MNQVVTLSACHFSRRRLSSIEYLACGQSHYPAEQDGDTLMCLEDVLQNENSSDAAMGMKLAPDEMNIIPVPVNDLAH